MDNSDEFREERAKGRENGNSLEKGEEYEVVLSRKEATEELLGCIVHSEEEAYKLYRDYGHRVGFSVRKGKQSYFIGTKNIRTKDYYCSKEGLKYDELVTEANFNRPDTRTNCKAMIRFRVDEHGEWKVIRFIPEHNHELAKPGERHMLRSARSLAVVKSSANDSTLNAEASPANVMMSSMDEVSDGIQSVAFTLRDCYNHAGIQNIIIIEPSDLQCLVSHFKRRTNEEGMFYWDVQVDQEGRMTNFFWRDGRSRNDYDCFGDVVLLETTNRTNKYNLVCAPFLGVNHHWQHIVFGCALLLDESMASYVWLFRSFLESMGGHHPKSIFSDQDEAIVQAIAQVFPNTQHSFSNWHIQRNMQSHLGTLNTSQLFHNMFTKCMQGCSSELEFEDCWATFLHEYKLQDNSWVANLYKYRDRWCSALKKDMFDGGINTSQWVENSNNIITGLSDESTSVTKFAVSFEKIVKILRRNESEEDFRCSQTAPVRVIKHSTVLKHAAECYTHKMYKLFEAEFLDGCGATSCHETPCGGTLSRFELVMQGRGSKSWTVLLDTSTMEVSCSCRKFETMGVLCSHVLKAFSLKNAEIIPDRYILKRWTKDARRRMYKLHQDESMHQGCNVVELAYRNRAMQYAYNLITKSQELEESRKIFWDTLESGEKALEVFFEMQNLHAPSCMKDKEGHGKDKRKKNISKVGLSSKKAKEAGVLSSNISELLAANGENRFPAAQVQSNLTSGRPFYYQPFPGANLPPGQMYIHPNLHHPLPLCAPQEFAAYGVQAQSNFGGTKNI